MGILMREQIAHVIKAMKPSPEPVNRWSNKQRISKTAFLAVPLVNSRWTPRAVYMMGGWALSCRCRERM